MEQINDTARHCLVVRRRKQFGCKTSHSISHNKVSRDSLVPHARQIILGLLKTVALNTYVINKLRERIKYVCAKQMKGCEEKIQGVD